jgi:hypothetical protein
MKPRWSGWPSIVITARIGVGSAIETTMRILYCSFEFDTTKQDERRSSGSGFSGSTRSPIRMATSICVPRTRMIDSRWPSRNVADCTDHAAYRRRRLSERSDEQCMKQSRSPAGARKVTPTRLNFPSGFLRHAVSHCSGISHSPAGLGWAVVVISMSMPDFATLSAQWRSADQKSSYGAV